MPKQTKSFSLDDDLAERLDNDASMNNSAVVNQLLREYLDAGETADVALKMRKRDLEDKLKAKRRKKSSIESEIERLEREIDDLQSQIEQRREDGIKEVVDFAEKIANDDFVGELSPENPAIQNKAQKAQMSPERFIDAVNDELEGR